MKFTILGARGFIGSHLVDYLRDRKGDCWAPKRGDPSLYRRDLGHLIYCIGLTADFRDKPYETVDAHVCNLLEVLKRCKYSSFLYLSSTRLYGRGSGVVCEDDYIKVLPADPDFLYNISKIQGESLCFATGNPKDRVARLSNVYGDDFTSDNFLPSLIRDAIRKKKLSLRTRLDSAKDYISISDVTNILLQITLKGRSRLYNVASGVNTTNRMITKELSLLTGCSVKVKKSAERISYPAISIKRIVREFGFVPSDLSSELHKDISVYKYHKARMR